MMKSCRFHVTGVLLLTAAICFAGCKKAVAVSPPQPALQPASPAPAPAIAPRPSPAPTNRVPVAAAAPAPRTPAPPRADARPSIDQLFRQNVQTIYFDYDQSEIRPDQIARLEANASWLKQNPGVKFRIEGNCDDRGSEEYNLALGDRRASIVRAFLVSKGVEQSRISTISFGEERPACRDSSESCFQRNRRADFEASTN